MSDLIGLSVLNAEETKSEIAGVDPEILVVGTKDKPYFEIKYFDTEDQCYHIGFGSYRLGFVFDWLKEFFGISSAKAVEAEPVRHGRWEWDVLDVYRCSACGEKSRVKEVMGEPVWDFCPNCGAKMDLEE